MRTPARRPWDFQTRWCIPELSDCANAWCLQVLLGSAFAIVSWTVGFVLDRQYQLQPKVGPSCSSMLWCCCLNLASTGEMQELAHPRIASWSRGTQPCFMTAD